MIGHASPVICSGVWLRPPDHGPRPEPGLPGAWAAALSAERQRAAMTAAEITQGLTRLGILRRTTLPYSPYQNAKQEAISGQVEGRLMAMFEARRESHLAMLDEATQAWPSSTTTANPLRDRRRPDHALPRRTRRDAAVPRQRCAPPRRTRIDHRMQRKSDGTIMIEGTRFEIPNRYRPSQAARSRCAGFDGFNPSTSSTSAGARCGPGLGCRTSPRTQWSAAHTLFRGRWMGRRPSQPRRGGHEPPPAAARQDARPAGRHRTPPAYLPKDEEGETPWNREILALYGLKWNPFAPDVPVEALHVTRRIESFCWRVQQARRRRRLRPRHRRPRHREVRHAAHSRRAPRRAARHQDRHRHAPAGRPRRLLSRDGRSVRRRAGCTRFAGQEPRCCMMSWRPTSTPLCRDQCFIVDRGPGVSPGMLAWLLAVLIHAPRQPDPAHHRAWLATSRCRALLLRSRGTHPLAAGCGCVSRSNVQPESPRGPVGARALQKPGAVWLLSIRYAGAADRHLVRSDTGRPAFGLMNITGGLPRRRSGARGPPDR